MKPELEVMEYESMTKTCDAIKNLQGRIYCYTDIPLEVRDELSVKLYEVRTKIHEYAKKRGKRLTEMGLLD